MSVSSVENNLDVARELIEHAGVDYKAFMVRVASTFDAKRYLEIGTQQGASLSMMPCDAIAIDPDFLIDRAVTMNKTLCLLFKMTSDRFFEKYSPSSLLGGQINIAFLDGMHRYEYLLRDFSNVEKHCTRNSVIFLHDCLPPTFEMTARVDRGSSLSEKYKGYWTGDVWKVPHILGKIRPDLKILFLDCPPTGLVMITNLDPSSRLIEENYVRLIYDNHPGNNDSAMLKTFIDSLDVLNSKSMVNENLTKYVWM